MVSKSFLTATRALLDICKYIIDQGVASRLMAIADDCERDALTADLPTTRLNSLPPGKWQRATENGDVLRGLSKPQAQRMRKHGVY
jgi:hypothetical protein